MAINSYTDLKTAVGSWLYRDAHTNIDDFIDLAEARFNRILRTRDMEAVRTLAVTSGTATVRLPADFLQARAAVLTSANPAVVLASRTPSQLAVDAPTGAVGRPCAFAIVGADLDLRPIPDAAHTVTLDYYRKLTPLDDHNPFNWLLTSHPDIYLFGALVEAAPMLRHDERLPLWEGRFARAVLELREADAARTFGDMPLVTRTDRVAP